MIAALLVLGFSIGLLVGPTLIDAIDLVRDSRKG